MLTNEVALATVENMHRAEVGTLALDVESGETFSATPGDYFWAGDGPLTNEDGEPLVLVVPVSGYRDAELS